MDRAELEAAFLDYQRTVEDIVRTGEWARFAELFTEDADYVEHAYGTFKGRDQIRAWIVKTMTTFPGSEMTGFPVTWALLDPDQARVVCEINNPMRDPGDGSAHGATNITILDYAGNGLWAREEDVYNPQKFADVTRDWSRIAQEHGTLSEEGVRLLAYLERA
jgi:uncharacterized protein (TIGR02246 family)